MPSSSPHASRPKPIAAFRRTFLLVSALLHFLGVALQFLDQR
jgi:hypothetical protein